MIKKHNQVIVWILVLISLAHALDNGLVLTPPMGWMTWERFRCNVDCTNDPENCISEHLVRSMADRLVDDGYLDAGYEYLVIDDCWLAHQRDPVTQRLIPDPDRFPSGIPALADYIHSKGLKFGIYEDFGTLTCGGYPGSIDHLELDAQTFAEWTVDYLKLDGCYADISVMDEGYPKMGYYLNKTNRPIVYSCSWPAYQEPTMRPNYTKIAEHCNLWRNFDDIDDEFGSLHTIVEWFAERQDNFSLIHGPGQWYDPDMLIIGNFGLSYGQSRAQMALWSIMAAPMIMSVDLRTIKPWFKEILQNKNLIAINQDKLGRMGKRFLTLNGVEMWAKQMTDDRVAFVFYYPEPYGTPTSVIISLKQLGLTRYQEYDFFESFSGQLIRRYKYSDSFNATVEPSGSVYAFWAVPVSSLFKKP